MPEENINTIEQSFLDDEEANEEGQNNLKLKPEFEYVEDVEALDKIKNMLELQSSAKRCRKLKKELREKFTDENGHGMKVNVMGEFRLNWKATYAKADPNPPAKTEKHGEQMIVEVIID